MAARIKTTDKSAPNDKSALVLVSGMSSSVIEQIARFLVLKCEDETLVCSTLDQMTYLYGLSKF